MPRVLIVGGGLAGLSAALFLNWYGAEAVLVERRRETSTLPKARRINVRTVEIFRQIGIAERVLAASRTVTFRGGRQLASAGPSLVAAKPLDLPRPPGPGPSAVTPVQTCLCAQDLLEPVLREIAAERGVELRFGVECDDWSEDADGITATVRAAASGMETIRADYLIAADGAHSAIRERLGIARSGRGAMETLVNIEFHADLAALVDDRENRIFQIDNEQVAGGLAGAGGGRWFFTTAGYADHSEREWADAMRAAIGVPGIEVRVARVMEWTPGMFIADRFGAGRVFLVGDAAHVMPPYAALGANTGIQAAHNLAWKLADVLRGAASARLLDTYHDERHPVGWFTADQSSLRSAADLRRKCGTSPDGTALADPTVLILGAQYRSVAVIDDGSSAPTDHFALSGQPGTRLPHRPLDHDRSTLDLIGPDFALLTGPDAAHWKPAVDAAARPGLRLHSLDAPWAESVSLEDTGALLVRPDQVVAWRARRAPDDPVRALRESLDRVLLGSRAVAVEDI
ncbi:FAD-dependent monooxygenase [Nocardia wallacei]|uniref:FAD-dependent monooxygenase n=1 Tax=Nocardia wallacei TaxID=480035 RepID=UPI002454B758|nr:FAD-dependent monooxygenase [Nocardia wallacei]